MQQEQRALPQWVLTCGPGEEQSVESLHQRIPEYIESVVYRSTEGLAAFAKSIQLEVLLEIHVAEVLEHICDETELVGVNNRDLKTFTVDINRSIELSKKIPADKIKIAESGINDIETIRIFRQAGFKGFLIGENFMKQPDPTIAFAIFVQQLNAKEK